MGVRVSFQPSDLKKLAGLVALNLDSGADKLSADLAQTFAVFDSLSELDTGGVAPLVNPIERGAFLREDLVTQADNREQYQAIAPQVEEGVYLVPQVIE